MKSIDSAINSTAAREPLTVDPIGLREQLARQAPQLWTQLSKLADSWTAPIIARLDARSGHRGYPKTFNDPVWGVVELYPWETIILDSPLLQRLRGVRQLGMAHLVYPGAGHDRLEHSRGAVEAADRMITALERNAQHRRNFGSDRDESVPTVSPLDRISVRLGALLHDIGHGPFSHATEPLLYERFKKDFDSAKKVLQNSFSGVIGISPGETIAVILVMSEAMRRVFGHEKFDAQVTPADLPTAISARILGSRSCLTAGYLSGIVSGPIDADKLDYMSRDCHHAGLPLGQDVMRLISKLEVVTITPDNALNPELRKRANNAPRKRFYDLGISQAGLGAYEQMIIGRIILYDRLYYHHKVRAAEAMVRALVDVAEEENGQSYSLTELFSQHSDDAMLSLIGGKFHSESVPAGKARAHALASAIIDRDIYYRAYAFAARYMVGLDGLPEEEQGNTRFLAWRKVLKVLTDSNNTRSLGKAIFDRAVRLASCLEGFEFCATDLKPEHIIVDLPMSNAVASRSGYILTRTESGYLSTPNLFFDPQRWSDAYEERKQCGFVFTPRRYTPLVSLAARIMFYEQFGLVMGEAADRASKTHGLIRSEWIDSALNHSCCGLDCAEALRRTKPTLLIFHADDFDLPTDWKTEDAGLAQRLATEFNDVLITGLPATVHESVKDAICHICTFVDMIEKGGDLDKIHRVSEKDLQSLLRNHLRSRDVKVLEGAEYCGGETDLILSGLIIENKVRENTREPFEVGPHYAWQERRYSIGVCSRVGFVVLAYKPSDETAILPLTKRIAIHQTPNCSEPRAQIRVVIPWGRIPPSLAKAP